jgi:hypothetical protein
MSRTEDLQRASAMAWPDPWLFQNSGSLLNRLVIAPTLQIHLRAL